MNLLWMGLALAAVALGVVLMLRRPAPPVARPRVVRPATPSPSADEGTPIPASPGLPVPPELADFHPKRASELAPERQAGVLQVFKDVPRPPKLLHHLLSPDFFGAASSAQLVDLISAEPLIAAKVLATVNSSRYALSQPVGSIGQAVTYLGMNTVRSLCLQYIVRSSFVTDTPERKQLLEQIWAASALASELTQRLTKSMLTDDSGSLVSAVVLSFLGRVALVAATPWSILTQLPTDGLLERERAEQDRLGICSAEIGRLLMTDWGLPAGLVADAADLDRVLVTPAAELADERGGRLALGYLCARLGERLANGSVQDLAAYDLAADTHIDLFHLRGTLGRPPLSRLTQALQAAELAATMQRLQASSAGKPVREAATA